MEAIIRPVIFYVWGGVNYFVWNMVIKWSSFQISFHFVLGCFLLRASALNIMLQIVVKMTNWISCQATIFADLYVTIGIWVKDGVFFIVILHFAILKSFLSRHRLDFNVYSLWYANIIRHSVCHNVIILVSRDQVWWWIVRVGRHWRRCLLPHSWRWVMVTQFDLVVV